MKIVTYNTHYAIGKDDQYDLDRIAASVQGADIIALQEVERNYGPPDQPSQPEDIASLFPHYYWVFDAAFDIDGCERNPDGTVLNRRRQHGQMLLSRWPILSKRYFPLPRLHIDPEFNMQMGVLEAVLDTPTGALRIYNMHFGSVASEERLRQANFILELVRDAPSQGGAWTGSASESPDRDWSAEMTQPPMPESALVLGDFNMQPNSPEYAVLSTAANENNGPLLTEIWTALNPGRNVLTWHPNSSRPGNEKAARLDYCFGTPDLAKRAMSSWVDQEAEGSDHQPLWIKLEACP
jgi:endonuclease/exonuclease/phosphatase family metal-dependent hydrolase